MHAKIQLPICTSMGEHVYYNFHTSHPANLITHLIIVPRFQTKVPCESPRLLTHAHPGEELMSHIFAVNWRDKAELCAYLLAARWRDVPSLHQPPPRTISRTPTGLVLALFSTTSSRMVRPLKSTKKP